MNNSVIVYVDYGNIYFNIKDIMKKNGLTKTQVAKKTGLPIKSLNDIIMELLQDMIKIF